MRVEEDPISKRALALADEFLAAARPAILELAEDDLEKLKESAQLLHAMPSDPTSHQRNSEHVAYALVASAFNESVARRKRSR
jgi:hypothetical protein